MRKRGKWKAEGRRQEAGSRRQEAGGRRDSDLCAAFVRKQLMRGVRCVLGGEKNHKGH